MSAKKMIPGLVAMFLVMAVAGLSGGGRGTRKPKGGAPDPVLGYSTYAPGLLSGDVVYAVTADSSGNSYLAGLTYAGGEVVFIEKVSADGTTVLYRYVLGAGYSGFPNEIRVDAAGDAYITGYATSGYPTTSNAYQQTVSDSNSHVILTEMNPAGASMLYSTYLAGSSNDYGYDLALDSSNNVYVTGYTTSSNFPVTVGVYQATLSQDGQSGFVAKLNPAASGSASLVYSTFLSGPVDTTEEYAIAVDAAGDAYVTGSGGQDFPISTGAYTYDNGFVTLGGVYVTELNPAGAALVYSAFIGPGAGTSIAVDAGGDAYVTGTPNAADFPTTAGAYQVDYESGFVTELPPGGASLVYSTFLSGPSGSSTNVTPQQIALVPGCASSCPAYVSGYTTTLDFPVVNSIQNFNDGGSDEFVVQLSAGGSSANYSSYLGGSGYEGYYYGPHEPGIAVLPTGDAITAGNTSSLDFPVTIATVSYVNGYMARINASSGAMAVPVPLNLPPFYNQPVSSSSAPQSLVLRNMGSVAMSVSSINFGGINPGDFSETDTCAASVPAGGVCTVNVTFTPTLSGARSAVLDITSNANDSPTMVSVSGTGVDAGNAVVSPSALAFPDTPVGSSSAPQTFSLSNGSDVGLQISSIIASANYSAINDCPPTLAPSASCTVSVTFTPTEVGSLPGSVSIFDNSGYGTSYVTLSGTGQNGSQILTVSDNNLNFGSVVVGFSGTQSAEILNTGNIPITISSVTGSGAFLADGCVEVLNPQQSCGVSVTFTPTASGVQSATVTIANNSSSGPILLNVAGTGVAGTDGLTVDPLSIVFPDQGVGFASAYQTVTVTNTGALPVTMDRVLDSGNFLVQYDACGTLTLQPGSSCYFNVIFAPLSPGEQSGAITIIDGAPNSPQMVAVAGNGLAATPALVVDPTSAEFFTQPVGTQSTYQIFTVFNTGDIPVTFSSIQTSANFAIYINECPLAPTTLAPGSSCLVLVEFAPTTTGPLNGTLTLTGSGPAQSVSLSGTGVTASQTLLLIPSSESFPSQKTGTQSAAQYLIVRNTGSENVTVNTITISGNFSIISEGCPQSGNQLAANSSCQIGLAFTPTASGTRTGTLTLNDSATGSPQTVSLTGTGASALPSTTLTPAALSYDQQAVGTSSSTQPVTLTNNTHAAITGLSFTPSGDFSISGNTCGTNLGASASCAFNVTFTPTVAGLRTGAVTIADSAGTQTVNLAGDGVVGAETVVLQPAGLAFTPTVVGSTNTAEGTQYVTYNNTGNENIIISSVVVAGADYAISYNGCPVPFTVGPGGSCAIGISFTPTATGTRAGTLTFTDNAPGSPRMVPLTGQGLTATQELVVSPASLVFTPQVQSTSSTPQYVYLTNGGNSTITLNSITESGSDFSFVNTCGTSLAAGANCYFYVTFTPQATGARTGAVTISSSAPGSPATVSLAGTGLAATLSLSVSPGSIAFGNQVQLTSSAQQYVYLTNGGNSTVSLTSIIESGADFSLVNTCGTSLTAGASCYFYVTFTPQGTGVRSGSVTITSNAPGSPMTVALAGTGLATNQQISLSQTSVNFGNQVLNLASPPMVVYYVNEGVTNVTVSRVQLTGSAFAQTQTCTGTIVAGGTCTISITFTPNAAQAFTGAITIMDSAPGSPRTISLAGTGVNTAPAVTPYPASVSLQQNVGAPPVRQLVGLTNTGTANVNISSITITGANSSDFAQANNCPPTLAAGAECMIYVTFNSSVEGSFTASLTITDNANGSPQNVPLTGSGQQAIASLSTNSLAFGNQDVGTTSAPQSVTLTNTGNATLSLSSLTLGGADPSDFAQTNTCGTSVAADASCTITATFAPMATGSRAASITLSDNAPNSPQVITLAGNGTQPFVLLVPNTLSFGNQLVNTTSPAQSVTLTNTGTGPLLISGIAISGSGAIDFSQSNTCGGSLAAGASCSITTTFSPSAIGPLSANINVSDNAPGSPQTIFLSGAGVQPQVTLMPASLSFGNQLVGATSALQNVTLSNTGTGTLTISSLTITGAGSPDFAQSNTCGTSVAAGATCTISVTFTPLATGPFTAAVTISDNAPGSPQSVPLSGTGTQPQVMLAPSSLAFGNQLVNTTSAAQNVVLTNIGTATLTITGISITGAGSPDFSQSNTCGGSVAAGANCTITVTFTPLVTGPLAASVTIADNAPGSPQSVPLSGTGTQPMVVLTPTSLTFATQLKGTSSPAQTVTLMNTGTATLTITGVNFTGMDPTDFTQTNTCGGSVAAGASCTFSVIFDPTGINSRKASLSITDNAPGSPQTVSLTGTGTEVKLVPSSLNFGTVTVGMSSAPMTTTLTNVGATSLSISSIAITGTDPSDYSDTTTCGGTVGAGASCTITVTFKPTATGTRTAAVSITDNGGGSPQKVTLTGKGA